MVIVAGHTRYEASKKLGLEQVPVVIADDLTEAQIKAYRIADNKTNEYAEWDYDLLKLEFDDLLNFNYQIENTGYTQDGIDSISKLTSDFLPSNIDDQGDLGTLDPKWIICPNCGKEFDERKA